MTFEPCEIKAAWDNIFDTERIAIAEVLEGYPEVRSVMISWDRIWENVEFGEYLLENPKECLNVGEEVLLYEYLNDIKDRTIADPVRIRITGMPSDLRMPVSGVSSRIVGRLVAVSGKVGVLSDPQPTVTATLYRCPRCGTTKVVRVGEEPESMDCDFCSNDAKKPASRLLAYDYMSQDYQEGTLNNNMPPSTSGSRLQNLVFIVRGDLTTKLTLGKSATLTGIIRLEVKANKDKSLETRWILDVISIEDADEGAGVKLSEEDVERIKQRSQSPTVCDDLTRSFAPDIYGNEHIKQSLLLMLVASKILINNERQYPHYLLLGDPGMGKSRLMEHLLSLDPRAVRSSGKSSSTAGLIAATTKIDGKWIATAGALALADGSIVCVDELDKLAEEDRAALNNALESGVVTINKAVHTEFFTRCSLFAAANPKAGRYLKNAGVDNAGLEYSLMSRFDLVHLMPDEIDKMKDEAMCEHICRQLQHEQDCVGTGHDEFQKRGSGDDVPFSHDDLMKYLTYARTIEPCVPEEVMTYITQYYLEAREDADFFKNICPVTPRFFHSCIRLSKGFAKLRLSD